MKLREDDLRRIFREGEEPHGFVAGPCPSDEALIASFSEEAEEGVKSGIIDHAAACPSCRRKFDFLRQTLDGVREIARDLDGISLSDQDAARLRELARDRIRVLKGKRPEGRPSGFGIRWRLLFASGSFRYAAAAAGLLTIVLAAVLVLRTPRGLEPDTERGRADRSIVLDVPKGEVGGDPLIFRWRPFPGALDYEVKLLDEELSDVWASERTPRTEVELPEMLFRTLERGNIYYWKVTARLEEGTARESDLQEFKLR